MIEVISEYIVHESSRGQFELVFSRGGAWSQLFSRSPGFRGTSLLLDEESPGRYLVVDLWDTPVDRENALAQTQSAYSELLARMSEWTESKAELGIFKIRGVGTVRPIEKPRQRGHKPPPRR